jgi:hypothetical protein
MKRDDSPQRGMVYEYFHVARQGQPDQFPEGEGLDTMHDGAWLAAALVTAYRATGEARYRDIFATWQLPFYLKMLNHSDELFTANRNDARPGATAWNREHGLQMGEKGFVPYWWDDGSSVSIERMREKNPLAARPSIDNLAGKSNPQFRLDGYSQGSSNHLAQDLAVMLELAWVACQDQSDEASHALAAELAAGTRNLLQCRLNHFGHIPMVDAAAGLASADKELMRRVPDPKSSAYWTPQNHYVRALRDFKPGERLSTPGFADDQQYRYYHGIARAGGKLPEALAFKTIYDALTEPLAWQYYCDDASLPPGLNRFDLHPIYFIDGKPQDYRSDRKGPYGGPRPVGSRMGPQNMVCCGWALQALRAHPLVWESTASSSNDGARTNVAFEPSVVDSVDAEGTITTRVLSLDHLQAHPTVPIKFPSAELRIFSSRLALHVSGKSREPPIAIRLFAGPVGQGSWAKVEIDAREPIRAMNDDGQNLLITGTIDTKSFDELTFSFTLPYTVAKGQAPWSNGIEHGRYSVEIGDEMRNYGLASRENDVALVLERELGEGLRTWQAIFDHYGYLPTGIRAGTVLPGVDWEQLSDAGAYAHLINAASQWLLYLDGKYDWEQHAIPAVE